MHQDPSGPGLALEKSTTPEKSGSSGSWIGENGRSGSAAGDGSGEGFGDGDGRTSVTRADNNPTCNKIYLNMNFLLNIN